MPIILNAIGAYAEDVGDIPGNPLGDGSDLTYVEVPEDSRNYAAAYLEVLDPVRPVSTAILRVRLSAVGSAPLTVQPDVIDPALGAGGGGAGTLAVSMPGVSMPADGVIRDLTWTVTFDGYTPNEVGAALGDIPGVEVYLDSDVGGWVARVYEVGLTIPEEPVRRLWPRSDGGGLSNAQRIWPPPPSPYDSNRIVGGYPDD